MSLACDDCGMDTAKKEAAVWVVGALSFLSTLTATVFWIVRSLWTARKDPEAMSFVTPRWLRRIGNL